MRNSFDKAIPSQKLNIPAEHKSEFVGYENDAANCVIEHYYVDEDNNTVFVLNKTPFYAESGGEVADTGKIFNNEFEIEIEDVQKQNDVIFHFGKLVKGTITDKKSKRLLTLKEEEISHEITLQPTSFMLHLGRCSEPIFIKKGHTLHRTDSVLTSLIFSRLHRTNLIK